MINFRKELYTLILPILRNFPISLSSIIAGFFIAMRIINYAPEEYRTQASIKIDHRDHGVTDFNLFTAGGASKVSKDMMGVIEVLKSKSLKKKTLKKLDFDISYHLFGKMKKIELYDKTPFKLTYSIKNQKVYDKPFTLRYLGSNTFVLNCSEKTISCDTIYNATSYTYPDITFFIEVQDSLIKEHPSRLIIGSKYAFTINSLNKILESVSDKYLFIKTIDKDSPILKLYYNTEVPAKAQKFLNTHIHTFIENSRTSKFEEATKTLEFIDNELAKVKDELSQAEARLTTFKRNNKVINTTMEVDVTLKELSQLDARKLNVDIQEKELQNLYDFIMSGNDFKNFSPNFETLSDPIFKDAYLKLQNYTLEKKDLLLRYPEGSIEVSRLTTKINDLKAFIIESTKKTLLNIKSTKQEVELATKRVNQKLKQFPDKERKLIIFDRNLKLKEQLFNYLSQKRTELAISKSSNISFHQIIDEAELPTNSIWPNKPLILGVCLFFALLIGLALTYIWHYLVGKVKKVKELQEYIELPVVGSIKNVKKNKVPDDELLTALYATINTLTRRSTSKGKTFIVTSHINKEGKTFTAIQLAKIFGQLGKKVLLIDMNLRKPAIHQRLNISPVPGIVEILRDECKLEEVTRTTTMLNVDVLTAGNTNTCSPVVVLSDRNKELLEKTKQIYDIVILDTAPIGLHTDTAPLMQLGDLNLFVARAKHTKIRHLAFVKQFMEQHPTPRFYAILNGV